ncbi:MAG: DMT family transporter [Maribacter sp.]|nr:DMT family transporter [Maribacter sp.]
MKKMFPILLLVLTMLFWAANFHLVKIALKFYSPLGVASWRFFFGVLGLMVILYLQFGKKLFAFRISRQEWWYLFLTSFFGIFLTIYFFNAGLKTSSAINGSLIIATSPAITALFSFLFQQKRLGILQWVAMGLCFFGVALILVKGDLGKLLSLQFEIGDLYILMMAVVFSLSQIIVSKYLTRMDAILMTSLGALIALPMFAAFSFSELMTNPFPQDVGFWSSVVFMGLLGTAFAYSAFYFCVVRVGPTTSTLYMNLIPFFTVVLAYPFGEKILGIQVIGGFIIIAGLLLFNIMKKHRERKLFNTTIK